MHVHVDAEQAQHELALVLLPLHHDIRDRAVASHPHGQRLTTRWRGRNRQVLGPSKLEMIVKPERQIHTKTEYMARLEEVTRPELQNPSPVLYYIDYPILVRSLCVPISPPSHLSVIQTMNSFG